VKASETWSVSAEWIIPAQGSPIHRGLMQGRGVAIEFVGPASQAPSAQQHRWLGNAAILPGLVNAHTHLELTCLRGQLPERRPMAQWLFAMLHKRPGGRKLDASVAEGAAEALATGTTALSDICHNNSAWRTLKKSPLRKLCFAEVLGIGSMARRAMGKLKKNLRGIKGDEHLRFGVAPHAPYSTSEEVYRQAIALARERQWPVATHLAESEAERQFLLRGTGKFFDFLAYMGLIDLSVAVHNCTPLAFARRVGLLEGPCILAHVNYIDDDEFKVLAGSGASVAYCPRSNDFFARSGHRYAEMLTAGINVALGTDSLASNSSLDMLEEMRRVRLDGKVDNPTILRMATLNGAKALGWDDRIGSLVPGKQADWIAVELPDEAAHPLEAILTSKARVIETVIAGKTVFRREAGTGE